MVGVSPQTGQDWAKQAKVRRAEQQARAGVIATKTDIAAELTRIGLHDEQVAPRDKVNALATASKLLGYDAPTRTENLTFIVHASTRDLIRQRTAARLAAQAATITQAAPAKALPAIEAGGGPPIEAASEPISPPPNISNQPAGSSRLPREAGMETALPLKPEGTR